MNHKRLILVIGFMLLALLLAACGSDDDDATPEADADTSADATQEAAPAQVTEEAAATDDPAVTPEPAADIPNLSADGQYLITVIAAFDNYDAGDVPGLEDGEKWVLVQMTINNQDAPPFTVTPDALQAVDDAGNVHPAEPPNAATQPPILGTEIPTGEPLSGFALFALPADAQIASIAWCLDVSCQEPLVAPVLVVEG